VGNVQGGTDKVRRLSEVQLEWITYIEVQLQWARLKEVELEWGSGNDAAKVNEVE
jgi:hypothetical protein